MNDAREFADDLLDAAPEYSSFYDMVSARDAEWRRLVEEAQARGRALGARDADDYLATPDATEEAAKGLVENPAWDYDGAREVEKEYYRRFARKCVARLADAIARRAGRGTK